MQKSWLPTRKWYALVASGVASIVAHWIVTGAFDDVERGMLGTLLVGAVGSYFKSNEDTPGGVPVAKAARSSWGRRGEAGYGLVELLVALVLVVLLVWVLFALLGSADADAAVRLRSSWG